MTLYALFNTIFIIDTLSTTVSVSVLSTMTHDTGIVGTRFCACLRNFKNFRQITQVKHILS